MSQRLIHYVEGFIRSYVNSDAGGALHSIGTVYLLISVGTSRLCFVCWVLRICYHYNNFCYKGKLILPWAICYSLPNVHTIW